METRNTASRNKGGPQLRSGMCAAPRDRDGTRRQGTGNYGNGGEWGGKSTATANTGGSAAPKRRLGRFILPTTYKARRIGATLRKGMSANEAPTPDVSRSTGGTDALQTASILPPSGATVGGRQSVGGAALRRAEQGPSCHGDTSPTELSDQDSNEKTGTSIATRGAVTSTAPEQSTGVVVPERGDSSATEAQRTGTVNAANVERGEGERGDGERGDGDGTISDS